MEKKYMIVAILAVCVIAGCVVWFGFYDNSKQALAEEVTAFEHKCPVEMAPGCVVESIAYSADSNNVVMRLAVTSTDAAVTADKERHTDKVTLMFQEPDYRHLLKCMVKAGAGLKLNYAASGSESIYKEEGAVYMDSIESSPVMLSPDEVAAIEHKSLLSGKERASIRLYNHTLMLSGMCPVLWSADSELVNVALDEDSRQLCMYLYTDKVGSPEYQIKLFKSELKDNRHRRTLVRDLVKELAAAGYGIKLCYLDADKTTIKTTLNIPASDIYNISQLR